MMAVERQWVDLDIYADVLLDLLDGVLSTAYTEAP